jgi:AcrR family transcriptional regulator
MLLVTQKIKEGNHVTKKHNIIMTATHLFATQGFDGTTTQQISKDAGVTEPLIYYHFTGKDEIYTTILASIFEDYLSRLKSLQGKTDTQFDKIENLFKLHFQLIAKMPDEMALVVSNKPAKLNDSKNVYSKNTKNQKKRLNYYLSNCLKKGIQTGEFRKVPVKETTSIIMMMINSILRQQDALPGKKLMDAIVDYCRSHLVAS